MTRLGHQAPLWQGRTPNRYTYEWATVAVANPSVREITTTGFDQLADLSAGDYRLGMWLRHGRAKVRFRQLRLPASQPDRCPRHQRAHRTRRHRLSAPAPPAGQSPGPCAECAWGLRRTGTRDG